MNPGKGSWNPRMASGVKPTDFDRRRECPDGVEKRI